MPSIEVRITADLKLDEVVALYEAVGWTAYTREPDTIAAGLRGASFVAGVFDAGRLVGLIREPCAAARAADRRHAGCVRAARRVVSLSASGDL
jgi:hypothetical protein